MARGSTDALLVIARRSLQARMTRHQSHEVGFIIAISLGSRSSSRSQSPTRFAMLRILALCLFLALASAFEAPVLSRRAFAKAFAAAPLAAAGAAFAVSASRSHPASRANPSPQGW